MNAVIHTAESLNSLTRKALVSLAIEAGVEKPHNTKSAALVEAILAKQPAAEPISVVATVETESEAQADNIVPFPAAEVVQGELPSEPAAKPVSHGIFKVNRKTFQRQLAAAARVASASKTMPVLSCVLIDFADGKLVVEANDLSNYVRTETQAETNGDHRLAIPHGVLSKFVSRCTSEFLMAEAMGDKLVISDLENRTEIMGIPESEWPGSGIPNSAEVMTVQGKQLVRVLTDTVKFASIDASRYVLNGVGIDTKGGVIVATDGRRLVRAAIGADKLTSAERVLILPTHACLSLVSGLPQDAEVKVTADAAYHSLVFSTEQVGFTYLFTARLVDANYPNYQQVIPDLSAGYGGQFEVGREELNGAIGRLLVVANASGKGAALKLDLAEASLTLNAADVSVGTGKEQVAVRCEEHAAPRMVAVNGDYLSDITGVWEDERLTVNIKDEVAPVVVRGADKLAVVMPVRLS